MKVTTTELPGVLLIEPQVFDDSRGSFFEAFHRTRYREYDIPEHFAQDNISHSNKGVLRGLHYQIGKPQGKLVWVLQGKVFDVAVDVRPESPTYGRHVSVILDDQMHRQLYIPPGYAHGFCVLSDSADFIYKCSDFYYPEGERGIRWDDPDLAIPWPHKDPILSTKDAAFPYLVSIHHKDLPCNG